MGVDPGPQPFGPAPIQDGSQDLISGPARLHFLEMDLLEPVPLPEKLPQPSRGFRLADPQHIGVVLHIRVEAQVGDAHVAVQQVPSPDNIVTRSVHLGVGRRALDVDGGMKPGVEAQV
jgi:hypothetical protein